MNLKHDEEWQGENLPKYIDSDAHAQVAASDFAEAYHEHMSRFIPASEWHDDDGDVLWYRLPVVESPYVGSPRDVGWETEPVHILSKGETNAEYYTHFQYIHTPGH